MSSLLYYKIFWTSSPAIFCRKINFRLALPENKKMSLQLVKKGQLNLGMDKS